MKEPTKAKQLKEELRERGRKLKQIFKPKGKRGGSGGKKHQRKADRFISKPILIKKQKMEQDQEEFDKLYHKSHFLPVVEDALDVPKKFPSLDESGLKQTMTPRHNYKFFDEFELGKDQFKDIDEASDQAKSEGRELIESTGSSPSKKQKKATELEGSTGSQERSKTVGNEEAVRERMDSASNLSKEEQESNSDLSDS